MASIAETLASAAKHLEDVTETPRLDAEILLAHSLELSRAQLLARLKEPCEAPAFPALLEQRRGYAPLAHILGTWEFFSLDFVVEAPLLVPRPETEHLVERVLEYLGARPAHVLELCTGTGCVAVSIAKHAPRTRLAATDIHPRACATAWKNARKHGVQDRLRVVQAELFEAFRPGWRVFDAVCANPPYVAEHEWDTLPEVIRRHEDPRALLAGPDGLSVIRALIAQAPRHLKPGGLLAFEMDGAHYTPVETMLRAAGYTGVGTMRDLAGHHRVAFGQCPETARPAPTEIRQP